MQSGNETSTGERAGYEVIIIIDWVYMYDTACALCMHAVMIASFPGPAQLSVACSTEKWFFVRAQGEPGNKATVMM